MTIFQGFPGFLSFCEHKKLIVKTVLCTQTPIVFLDLSSGCDSIDLLYASCITGCWLTPAASPRVDKPLVLEMSYVRSVGLSEQSSGGTMPQIL